MVSLVDKIDNLYNIYKATSDGSESSFKFFASLSKLIGEDKIVKKHSLGEDQYIVVRSGNDTIVYATGHCRGLSKLRLGNVPGNLIVAGGENLVHLAHAFENTNVQGVLDLSLIKSKGIGSINRAFSNSRIGEIRFGNMYTGGIISADEAFQSTRTKSIDLSKLDLSKLNSMRKTFKDAHIGHIKMNDMKLSELHDIDKVFADCICAKVDFYNLDVPKLTRAKGIFNGASIKELNLYNIDMSNVEDTSNMFDKFKSDSYLKLSSLGLKPKHTENMFNGCKLSGLDLTGFEESKIADFHISIINGACIGEVVISIPSLEDTSMDLEDVFNSSKMLYFTRYTCANDVDINLQISVDEEDYGYILDGFGKQARSKINKIIVKAC